MSAFCSFAGRILKSQTGKRRRMARHSSGLMAYRWKGGEPEVFLVHPGGPFWVNKDRAVWSIPKGEFDPGREDSLDAAKREFREETGFIADGEPFFLGRVKQQSGKIVHAWAVEADLDPERIASNSFQMEWPKGSGKRRMFPEVDRAEWCDEPTARYKLNKGQVPLLDLLLERLGMAPASE
jgi:predicted NUDIX family NTP pyrophosphohydrolase